ncbi:hypothetical protein K456DRAFT_1691448 [Colletotrichum gloeosporioides 23]|nr:hypothetical protein K456DRAFT_1691448 [Colletotrichum gloeosporioides 23]
MPKFVVAGRAGPNQLPAHEVIVDGCHTVPYMRETESWFNLSAHAPTSPLEYPAPSDARLRPHKRKGRSQQRLGRRNKRAPCIILSVRQRELEQARTTNRTFPGFFCALFSRDANRKPQPFNPVYAKLRHWVLEARQAWFTVERRMSIDPNSLLLLKDKPHQPQTTADFKLARLELGTRVETQCEPRKELSPFICGGRRVDRTPADTLPQLFALPHGHTLFAGSPECDCSHRGFSLDLRRFSEHRLALTFLVWRCTQFRPLPPFAFLPRHCFFPSPNWSDMCSSRLRNVSVGYYPREPLASTFAPVR